MRRFLLSVSVCTLIFSQANASEELKGRAEVNWRYGDERSILMTEFWVPLSQDENSVLYGDVRLMGDDQDNREGNLGLGYRKIMTSHGLNGVAGVHGWLDRRITERGSEFHQITTGAEWLGESFDVRLNGYIPLSDGQEHIIPNANPQGPELAGTGILVDTDGTLLEEPQHGLDLELGVELGQHIDFIKNQTDSLRVYGGGYYFDSDNTENVAGWRTRFTSDITENILVGARFQRDDERGSQGFLEATIRFPFGNKKSYRKEGLRARLDESPERDIDIVTGDTVTSTGDRVPVVNNTTGEAQEVLTVDNTSAAGGDGSIDNPFNTLADAQAAASAHTIIYVREGDGTSTNQDQGITLDKQGQQLIGSGSAFVFDNSTFGTANGQSISEASIVIAEAGTAPVIGNVNAGQDGVTVSADNITVAGVTIDNGGTGRDGISVKADGASASAQNITIQNVTAQNARMGIYLHGTNSGALSAMVQNTTATSNSQHGIVVYDDTDSTFTVDLGGGTMGSTGNNVLAGNTLEDLAVDYDGRTLAAQNNWWGQTSGPDTDNPTVGIDPQIYYGAPINDGLLGHWTFDNEWTTNTTAFDRSGNDNDGTLQGGLSLTDLVTNGNRQGLEFTAVNSEYVTIGPNNTYIPMANSEITIIAEHTPASITAGVVDNRLVNIRRFAASSGVYLSVGSNDNVIYFTPLTNFEILADTTISTGTSSNAALTFNGTTFTGYVNGTADSNVQVSPLDAGHAASDAVIGSFDGAASFYDGVISDTRIYSRALNASEISELDRMDTSSSVDTSGFLTINP